MNATTGMEQLATALRARGLTVDTVDATTMKVANPMASGLAETLRLADGSYRTEWGYEIGQTGEEIAAADRLAFLMGVPTGRAVA